MLGGRLLYPTVCAVCTTGHLTNPPAVPLFLICIVVHSIVFSYCVDELGETALKSIKTAWVARLLTTFKSSCLYHIILYLVRFALGHVARLVLKPQAARALNDEEHMTLLPRDITDPAD